MKHRPEQGQEEIDMAKWAVRAEIPGEFVIRETFDTEKEAREYMDELIIQGIWETIELWRG